MECYFMDYMYIKILLEQYHTHTHNFSKLQANCSYSICNYKYLYFLQASYNAGPTMQFFLAEYKTFMGQQCLFQSAWPVTFV